MPEYFIMPANLNALIRYKTINSCLSGGKRRWSIPELIEKCSDALAEYRGRYKPVSIRTIRDDIRVMRSDILGYNAPIEQQKGLYYYSDPEYSIMTISITDSGLIERIIRFLGEIKQEVTHPELEIILDKLISLKFKHLLKEKQIEEIQFDLESSGRVKHIEDEESTKEGLIHEKAIAAKKVPYRSFKEGFEQMMSVPSAPVNWDFKTWGDIFLMIK